MTSTLAQGAGRSPGESARPLRALAASPALIVLLLGGLALRLTIAYVLFPSSGFETDLVSYTWWAATMSEHGPGGFYENAGFADYPPAYLYVLWLIGLIAERGADAGELIKLPPILLDVAVAYVIYRLVLGWAWPGRRAESMALVAAALYLFNPVSFYDSALWGQTDAAGAVVLLLGIAALIRGNSEGAAALAATAALVKPQFGVLLLPLVVFVLVKRHLVRPGSGPRHPPWAPPVLARWLTDVQGWPRLVSAAAAAWAAFFILALPFGMGPIEYVERMFGTAGGYGYLTVNAFNLWALVSPAGAPSLADALTWTDDTLPLLGPIPAVVVGAVLLTTGFLWGTLRGAIRDDRWTLLVAVTFLAIAFFVLPTRVHERYVFPAIALMPLLAVVSGRWALALLLLSVGAFINLHAILTLPLYGSDDITSLPLGEWFRSRPLVAASALLQTGVGLWAAWQLRPSLRTSPDGFDRAAARRREHEPATTGPGSRPHPSPPTRVAPVAPPATTVDTSRDEAWVRGPSTLDWVIARFSRVPIRRDRTAELAGEPGGRVDRLDVLIVVVLIVFAVTLRGYRLDQPTGMYFDEVYHARTATEFLQHWEYDEPHAIYEFTHPHLAKYAMAWGIRLAGGNEVKATTHLGTPVEGAAIERRWAPDAAPAERNGERLYVGSGDTLFVYDLATRDLVDGFPVAAAALAVDEVAHRLYIADSVGAILVLDTEALDARRHGRMDAGGLEAFSAGPGAPVERLVVSETSLLAISQASISSFDKETGALLSERFAFATPDAVPLPWAKRLVVDTRALTDRGAASVVLAEVFAGTPRLPKPPGRLLDSVGETIISASEWAQELATGIAEMQAVLAPEGYVVVDAYLDEGTLAAVEELIDAGDLPGAEIENGPLIAVAGDAGISVLDAWTLDLIDEIPTAEPVAALVLVERGLGDPTLYAASGAALEIVAITAAGPSLPDTLSMPGPIGLLAWNEPAGLVHALGEAPDGGPSVYVVEPNGNAVFIDVPLPVEPSYLLADTQPQRPHLDRGELLAIGSEGTVATIGIDHNAFGWRLPGVLLGALAAGLLYLLARVLFARRSVGLIAAVLILAEGMLFANSRIGMNDVYVTTFVIAAVLLFAPLYLAPRRPWTALVVLLGAGLALGLALASKWVGIYAIGGLLLLVLLRSGLGRIIALVVMIGLTSVLGAMAIRAPPVEEPNRNWAFLLLMLLLTGLLTAAMVRRPAAITRGEAWLGVAGPLLLGLALAALGLWVSATRLESVADDAALSPGPLLVAGGLCIISGVIVGAVVLVASRAGRGPFAWGPQSPDAGTSGWLRPGWLAGLPWLFTLAALSIVPVGLYIVSYAPWVELGNQWGLPLLGSLPFLPEGSEGGKTLAQLTESIYQYHDNLRAEHAASSPWWAWPLDLKPVWFFSERYAGPTSGLIYDTGNLVIFWLGIPAMAFTASAAWRRRSVALALAVLMWASLWLPWVRIDRATFQYHVYASLPFLILALSYFLAELWHGPSHRTWFLARVAGALAILAIPLMWLLRTPLCILAGTAVTHPDGVACAGEVTRTAQFSEAGTAALAMVAVGAALAGLVAWRGARSRAGYPDGDAGRRTLLLASLVVIALVTLGGVVAALLLLDSSSPVGVTLTSDVLAIIGLVVLAMPAWLVLWARDSRRYVLGVLAIAVLWLLIWYPNISGLPLPTDLAPIYQGILPTWSWDFQFAVNTDIAVDGQVIDLSTLVIGIVTVIFVIGVASVAWLWGRSTRSSEAPDEPAVLPETPRS